MWATLTRDLEGGEYLSNCAVKVPGNPQAVDPDMPANLWSKTEEILADIDA